MMQKSMAWEFDMLSRDEAMALAPHQELDQLLARAASLRDAGHGEIVTFSRKVFIPLTQLCRDVCHYCTFAQRPHRAGAAFLTREQVIAIARAGLDAGCDEVLFTLGDKPELRYSAARAELDQLGYESTLAYLHAMAKAVLDETGLLPHLNAGLMTEDDLRALRSVSASQGLMLETAADRLGERGGPHFGSPDKAPRRRLEMIAAAGRARIPFTTGILIGIGETRTERIEALLLLRDLHLRHGHIQEIIVQNFRAKPGTRMSVTPEPDLEEHLWTIAVARLIFGPAMSIQAPPNLRVGDLAALLGAGVNDWGGVSPITPDHVNPEAPWPALSRLASETRRAGKTLVPRLTIYPRYFQSESSWLDPAVVPAVLRRADGQGFAHETSWRVGRQDILPMEEPMAGPAIISGLNRVLEKAIAGRALEELEIQRLFEAHGDWAAAVREAADVLRRETCGQEVSYVVTRNINYTNVCSHKCQFCAFSKGKTHAALRGSPYDLEPDEIVRRAREAWERGATEVCMQGGIHPDYSGETYLTICRIVKEAVPGLHVHAFSQLEIFQGARSLNIPVADFLRCLRDVGLGSLPGTAAEILDDEIRQKLCAEKLTTDLWLDVIEAAHKTGLRTTATIMFGHIERYEHWARHLVRIRRLQQRTGGFTEFVPLPFVHMEAPIYLRGGSRQGPSLRESLLMHAVSRLALHGAIANIQTSWVKMGRQGAALALESGANDLGGTLMNESISRAAGTEHGQEFSPESMEPFILASGRVPRQRTTLYGTVAALQRSRSLCAAPVAPVIQAPAGKSARIGSLRAMSAN